LFARVASTEVKRSLFTASVSVEVPQKAMMYEILVYNANVGAVDLPYYLKFKMLPN
jgi:hypothetical protein